MRKFTLISLTIILGITNCNCQENETIYKLSKDEIYKIGDLFINNDEFTISNYNLEYSPDQSVVFINYEYISTKENTSLTSYFAFKTAKSKSTNRLVAIIDSGSGGSCTGVNCSSCRLLGIYSTNERCECQKVGSPDAGPSYCNHSTSSKNIKELLAIPSKYKYFEIE